MAMERINFSTENLQTVFATRDYNEFSQLMFDTGMNKEKVSKDEANDKIREIMFEVLGTDKNSKRKDIRRAFRRHKEEVFEVIEETVENLLISGWGDNPFFNEFVEVRNMNDGDTNEFYVEDDVILSISELSGNHHQIWRQRLGEGSTFRVKTSWYGAKIYFDFELFMTGKIDWNKFVNKIYEAYDKMVNDMVYSAVMASGTKVLPASQFNKTGKLDASTKDSFIELIEDVQAATGDEVVIMGTKSALSKLNGMTDVEWISAGMKEERHTTGRLGMWEGVRLVEIPQRFATNDTSKKLVDNTKLLIMPVADNKFIKIYNEGEAMLKEVSDSSTNMDMTIEYEFQKKMGIATIIGKKFGMWTITN